MPPAQKQAKLGKQQESAKPATSSVIPFYSDKQGKQYREFSNFCRLRDAYEFKLPACAWREGFPTSSWCFFSEKAIMLAKAAMMGDLGTFKLIEAADTPQECKALGRKVKNFDDQLWQKHLEEVALEVVRQKFASDASFRKVLLATGDSILVEAAPSDTIWGAGLAQSDPRIYHPSQWRGRNILGYALMQARDSLRGGKTAQNIAGLGSTGDAAAAAVTASPAQAEACNASSSATTSASMCKAKRWGRGKDLPICEDGPAAAATPQNSSSATGSAASSTSLSAPTGAVPSTTDATSAAGPFDCFAVLDFEATCDEPQQPQPQEIIELPIVLVDVNGKHLREFRTYVRPTCHPMLSRFCTELTGISQADVDSAPAWSQAFADAQQWLDAQLTELSLHSCIFITCGDWDLQSMLGRQCHLTGDRVPAPWQRWINIKNLFRQTCGRPGSGMKGMLSSLGLSLHGRHHSGLHDSRNIARILQELLRRGCKPDLDSVSNSSASCGGKSKGGKRKGK